MDRVRFRLACGASSGKIEGGAKRMRGDGLLAYAGGFVNVLGSDDASAGRALVYG